MENPNKRKIDDENKVVENSDEFIIFKKVQLYTNLPNKALFKIVNKFKTINKGIIKNILKEGEDNIDDYFIIKKSQIPISDFPLELRPQVLREMQLSKEEIENGYIEFIFNLYFNTKNIISSLFIKAEKEIIMLANRYENSSIFFKERLPRWLVIKISNMIKYNQYITDYTDEYVDKYLSEIINDQKEKAERKRRNVLFIKTLYGKTFNINYEYSDTILKIKKRLGKQTDMNFQTISLIYAGRSLPDMQTIQELGIVNESTVHVLQNMRGD